MTGAVPTITNAERRARLGRRHLLATPATSVHAVAEALVGLHSSDPITPYLSVRARLPAIAPDEITDTLYTGRSLMRVHAMRRTMFVAPTELASTMTAACTTGYAPRERARLLAAISTSELAVDGDAAATFLDRVATQAQAALRARREATTQQLVADVPELGGRVVFGGDTKWASAIGIGTKVLFQLALEGRIARSRPLGSWVSSQYRWVPIEAFVGRLGGDDPVDARTELARRWLTSYGPGTTADLQWWSGWTKAQTLAALASCGVAEVELEELGPGWTLADDANTPAGDHAPWVALLPGLDPSSMGWKQRTWYVAPDLVGALYDRNGNAGPIVVADGRAVGGWSQTAAGDVRVRILVDVGSEHRSMIDHAAADLADWLGDTRIRHRFRSPLDVELAAT